MAPADQGLEAGERHVVEAGDGLVVDLELAAVDGAAKLALAQGELGALVAHRRPEGLEGIVAAALGNARTEEHTWNEDRDYKHDAASAAPVAITVPLPEQEGVYDLRLSLYPKRITNLVRGKPLATRKIQLVVVAPVRPVTQSTTAWQSVLEFDPASPKWWDRMARLAKRWLPLPRILHPYPSQRLCVIT